jgi:aldehyde dehydrogenase (NAD+)
LELGGNNAIIISKDADLDMSLVGAVFGAVGTAGQRCTSTRRLIIHESVYDTFRDKLVNAYKQLKIGNPLDQNMHVGPLIDKDAVNNYLSAIQKCKAEGGNFIVEGGALEGSGYESGCYVKPAIIEMKTQSHVVKEETFAPILYLMKCDSLEQAIAVQNDVPQGLSSSLFTLNFIALLSTAASVTPATSSTA